MELIELKLRDAAEVCRLREAEQQKRVAEAISPQLFTLMGADSEDASFRRITSPATLRDLNPLMHERMQAVCFYLAVTTPFGKRIIRVMVDYIVGEGFKAIAEDRAVQEVIERFWKNPVNKMDENIEALAQELLTFGEICLPVAVNPVDGFVRVGYIDPQEVEAVEYALMETGASQEITIPVAVKLKQRIGESEGRRLEIVRTEEDANAAAFGQLRGDCFYFAINKPKAASRGISEIFNLADWIDVFDSMVFDFADRVRILNSYLLQYVVKGGDAKAVKEMEEKVTKSPPRTGSVLTTNDQIEIRPISPDLKGADMSAAAQMVKLYGLGGAGLPAWFFADPVDANRATAQEMQGPTGKMLTNKQNVMKRIVTAIIAFVLDQAVAHGVLPGGTDLTWKLQVPDLSVRDIAQTATSLQTVANAAGMAEDRGWIRAETAARVFHTLLTQVGVEVDADEFEQARQEKQDRQAQDVNALNPQANLADALKKLPPATGVTQ